MLTCADAKVGIICCKNKRKNFIYKTGWIQKQVAAELAIGYSNYHKMENSAREPSFDELQKLAKIYSITVFHIIDKMLTTKKFKDFFQKNIAAL